MSTSSMRAKKKVPSSSPSVVNSSQLETASEGLLSVFGLDALGSTEGLPSACSLSRALCACNTPIQYELKKSAWNRYFLAKEFDGSQYDMLRDLSWQEQSTLGSVIALAETGRGFHGQRGRAWVAPRGNVYLCAAFPLDMAVSELGPSLMILPAVAAAEAIELASHGVVKPGIKWVNDLLVEGQKVAGVLSSASLFGERVRWGLVGIGINVSTLPEVDRDPAVPGVAALTRYCPELSLAMVVPALLASLARWRELLMVGARDALFEAYRERAVFVGQNVAIYAEGQDMTKDMPLYKGIVESLKPNLNLKIAGYDELVRGGRMVLR